MTRVRRVGCGLGVPLRRPEQRSQWRGFGRGLSSRAAMSTGTYGGLWMTLAIVEAVRRVPQPAAVGEQSQGVTKIGDRLWPQFSFAEQGREGRTRPGACG